MSVSHTMTVTRKQHAVTWPGRPHGQARHMPHGQAQSRQVHKQTETRVGSSILQSPCLAIVAFLLRQGERECAVRPLRQLSPA